MVGGRVSPAYLYAMVALTALLIVMDNMVLFRLTRDRWETYVSNREVGHVARDQFASRNRPTRPPLNGAISCSTFLPVLVLLIVVTGFTIFAIVMAGKSLLK